jgi:uncharacterized coiled-coil protein SlyX
MELLVNILFFIQDLTPEMIPDGDTLLVTKEYLEELIKNTNTKSVTSIWDTIFKLAAGGAISFAGIWQLVKFINKKRQDRKDAAQKAELERKQKEQSHQNQLEAEMFQFDKEKYMNLQEANQSFQKTIINEIFSKFVEQSQWITNLHDKSIENLVEQMNSVNKLTKDTYVQLDLLTNRVRNIEERFVKNSSIIVAKVDTLIKLLAEEKKIDKKVAEQSAKKE